MISRGTSLFSMPELLLQLKKERKKKKERSIFTHRALIMTHIFSNPSGSVGWNQSQLTYRQHRRLFLSTFHKSFLCSSCIIRNIFVIFLLTKNIFDIGDSTITQEGKRNILWSILAKELHPSPSYFLYLHKHVYFRNFFFFSTVWQW